MFKFNTKEPTLVEKEIASLFAELNSHEAHTATYAAIVTQIEKLMKAQSYQKDNRISKDTLVSVGGSLAGILMILNYEHLHVVTSKAIGFVLKTKL